MARLLAVTLVGTLFVAAPAVAQQPRVDEIPTRITQPARQPTSRVQIVQAPPVPQASAQGSTRVEIHHLYDAPENIHLRSDLRTFYLPHGLYATVPTDSAAWALEAAYLARDPYDQQRLLQLYRFREHRERRGHLLTRHEQAVRSGLDEMRRGDYVRATAALSLAADLNHGDPAARIHLAQARLARGHFEEAAAALRRALELQPKLRFLELGLERYYPAPGTLEAHTRALDTWLRGNRATADAHFLLGFLSYQTRDYETAHAAFQRVAKVRPQDELTRSFVSMTRP